MIRVQDLVCSLIIASEKAAHLARICRQNKHLLSLLVEEKPVIKKHDRLIPDFKTLADVLIQQSIKFDLKQEFPDLKDCIYGEENDSFTNTNGDSVIIALNENKDDTLRLLRKVLDGDEDAAKFLAECVHSQISVDHVPVDKLPSDCGEYSAEKLAIWIDPIDSTTEFINGKNTNNYEDQFTRIPLNGLNCVTVLIGVFDRTTGIPIIGVMNQPFYLYEDNKWRGRCFWGVCYDNYSLSCVPPKPLNSLGKTIIAVSGLEKEEMKEKLEKEDFTLISPAGAGFKILCVILDLIDAYVLSCGSTYYWDTCGCHAILKSLGGNIWNYQHAVQNGHLISILYEEKRDQSNAKLYSNKCGIIASKDDNLSQKIVDILKENEDK